MQGSPAEVRNGAARRLIARGRFREALDVLNEAVRMDPRWAESYENRANVFERLGMYPQAEADRRKVDELGGVQRPPPPPTPEPAPKGRGQRRVQPRPQQKPPAEPSAATTDTPTVPRYPARPPRRSGGAAVRTLGTILVGVGLLAAVGVGIYLAVNTISSAFDDDEQTQNPGGASGTPDASGSAQSPTPTPVDPDDDTLAGDPLSFTRFKTAWQGKGITATPGGEADGFTGFKDTPAAVTLTRAGQTMEIAMFFYDGPAALAQEWDVSPTAGATPKGTRTTPPSLGASWYNVNVVVVVIDLNDAIKPDAFEAFANIGA